MTRPPPLPGNRGRETLRARGPAPVAWPANDPSPAPAPCTSMAKRPSRRMQRTVARVANAAAAHNGDEVQVLGFTPRDFVLFGLPYKNPKTPLYLRRSGALTFTITGGTLGVPFAQDRLLVIWLATVFKICGSPESNAIGFDSLNEVAKSLGKASSGQQRRRIETGFLRLFDATFLAEDLRPNAIRRERYQLMRRMRLWKENDARRPNQHTVYPNILFYDQVFANDIRQDAIPTDFRSVVALSDNLGPLAFYQFQAYRSYTLARKNRPDIPVPILGPSGVLAQIGCNVKVEDARKARQTARLWHGIVKRLWPACPNELARDDTVLIVRAGYAIQHGRLPRADEFGVRPLDEATLEQMREVPAPAAIDRERVLPLNACSARIPRARDLAGVARAGACP